MSDTPALEGAKRGHIECDLNVDSLAYWNDPQGRKDREFRSPFAAEVRLWFIDCYPEIFFFSEVYCCRERISTLLLRPTEGVGIM